MVYPLPLTAAIVPTNHHSASIKTDEVVEVEDTDVEVEEVEVDEVVVTEVTLVINTRKHTTMHAVMKILGAASDQIRRQHQRSPKRTPTHTS